MLALLEREKTQKGQKIEANLLRTGVFMNASPISEFKGTGKVRGRIGNRSWYAGASDLYQTKDNKQVYISTVTRHLFERSMELMGRTDLLERDDIKTDYDRFLHREELDKVLSDWVALQDSEQLAKKFEAARLPYGFVYDSTEVDTDPGIIHDNMLVKMTTNDGEKVTLAGVPFHLKGNPGSVRRPAPGVGQHNHEIFKDVLGMTDDEIAWLEDVNVI